MNLDNNWSDDLVENYDEWGARYVVANIEIPRNTLVTGFEIHAKTAGLVSLNVSTLTFSKKTNILNTHF